MERVYILTTTKINKKQKINSIDEVGVNKILFSKKEPYDTKKSFKYFIGYNDNDVIRPLCVRLAMLKNLMKMQQCLLKLTTNSFKKL